MSNAQVFTELGFGQKGKDLYADTLGLPEYTPLLKAPWVTHAKPRTVEVRCNTKVGLVGVYFTSHVACVFYRRFWA